MSINNVFFQQTFSNSHTRMTQNYRHHSLNSNDNLQRFQNFLGVLCTEVNLKLSNLCRAPGIATRMDKNNNSKLLMI